MSKKVQVIEKGGRAEYAVLPWDEYEKLRDAAEDATDSRTLRAALIGIADEEPIPIEITERVLAGEHPVRVWRTHRGLTQKALAEAAGTTQTYLSQIESGHRVGSMKTLNAVARALEVNLETLLPVATEED